MLLYFITSRVLHVYEESQRVLEFASICRQMNCDSPAAAADSEEQLMIRLGSLMNASDESLSLNFDCGCCELFQLTDLARSAGAYGSRLTGAGWGGCTVSLVSLRILDDFMKAVSSRTTKQLAVAVLFSQNSY